MAAASVGTEVDASVAEGTAEATGWVSPAGVSGAGVLAGGAAASGLPGAAEVAAGASAVAAGASAVAALKPCQFVYPTCSLRFQVLFQLTGTQSVSCGYSNTSVLPNGRLTIHRLASISHTVMDGVEKVGTGAKALHVSLSGAGAQRRSIAGRVVAVLL